MRTLPLEINFPIFPPDVKIEKTCSFFIKDSHGYIQEHVVVDEKTIMKIKIKKNFVLEKHSGLDLTSQY